MRAIASWKPCATVGKMVPRSRVVLRAASSAPSKGIQETGLGGMFTFASTRPFFVTGTQRMQQPLTLFLRDNTANRGAAQTLVIGTGSVDHDMSDALVKASEPAPTERQRETVLDPSYRNTLRMKASSFVLDTPLPTPEMLADIVSLMQTGGPKIHALLHEIRIYGPDGVLQVYVDTPTPVMPSTNIEPKWASRVSNPQFGSLVVALPCACEGGELIVRHDGETVTLPLGGASTTAKAEHARVEASDPAPGGPLLHFAAFSSDCRHEVLPVTSGHRITLTYNLLAARQLRDDCLLSTVRPLESGGMSPLVRELRERLAQADWYPEGTTLGFIIKDSRRYADSLMDLNDSMFPDVLEGGHRLLYAALCQELRLEGRIAPIHWAQDEWEDEEWGREDGDAEGEEGGAAAKSAAEEKRKDKRLIHLYIGDSFDGDKELIGPDYDYIGIDCNVFITEGGFTQAAQADVEWVNLSETVEDTEGTLPLLSYPFRIYNDGTYLRSGLALLVEVPRWGSPKRVAAVAALDGQGAPVAA